MRDDDKLPAVKLGPDGKLLIEGDERPYMQGMIRTLWLDVQNINLHRGYSISESDRSATTSTRISGTGIILRRDKLAVAGLKSVGTTEIPFSIRPVPNGNAKLDWHVDIGFLPYDREIGGDEQFYLEGYCPQTAFDDLETAYGADKLRTERWVVERRGGSEITTGIHRHQAMSHGIL